MSMGKKKREKPYQAEATPVPHDVQEALDVGKEIVRVIEEDVDERTKTGKHADYFESIEERSTSICGTIERTNRVSEAQRKALDNMLNGVRKWVHDDD